MYGVHSLKRFDTAQTVFKCYNVLKRFKIYAIFFHYFPKL